MSFSYYKLLFFSLAITTGIFLLYYVYRSYIRKATAEAGSPRGFARLLPIEIPDPGGELQVRFETSDEQEINLEICDDSHTTLYVLASKVYVPGEYVIRFDSSKLSGGTYFFRLKTSRQEIFKKIQLGV
jgi:hypothetical protein